MDIFAVFTPEGIPSPIFYAPRDGAERLDLTDIPGDPILFLACHRRVDGLWVPREVVKPVEPTAEEIAAEAEAEAAASKANEARARKLTGLLFEGVPCSATSADQSGLMAVLLAIQMQGAAFRPTRFEFENGSELVIHLGNYQAFAAQWMAFRQSFFRVEAV